jgi:1-deoxy-D-xylulose 5-phosphate reductoisomerase
MLDRLPYSRIEAVIHPRSVVHSLVESVHDPVQIQAALATDLGLQHAS